MNLKRRILNILFKKEIEEIKEKESAELISTINDLQSQLKIKCVELALSKKDKEYWMGEAEDQCNEKNIANMIASYTPCLVEALKEIVKSTGYKDYRYIYYELSSIIDPDGFNLYNVAEKITHIDVFRQFPTEDALGRFETCNGFELLRWLKSVAFGEIVWKPLNASHEIAESVSFEGKEDQIMEFENKLYQTAVEELLFSAFRLKSNEMILTT